ncbi:MAG: hypothetical protein JWM63_2842 [Gammaproteobacteria bacterium]|nr:hypothetical protein [Gammaproteobacteria bacterium]
MPLLPRPSPALILVLLVLGGVWVTARPADLAGRGERIYREGILPSGAALLGARQQGGDAEGAIVACVNCHRRSGLGSGEGSIRIPPITGKYLFATGGVPAGRPQLDAAAASDARRAPYDDASLAAAIRSGIGRGGRKLSYLMPRYALDDASMALLIAHLKTLATQPSPGVSDSTIDFATIFTPDADPTVRDGVLAVLNQFIVDKNAFIRGGSKPLHSQRQIDYRVTRRWQLHVWTLQGPPESWDSQLHAHLHAEPVFAVLSGLAGRSWSPIHRFCESERLPCLFPNVEAPVDAEQDFYSVYFSKGLLLEADVIGPQLRAVSSAGAAPRLVQVYVAGDSAEAAAQRLTAQVPVGLQHVERAIVRGDAAALAQAVAEAQAGDTLVLWLRPDELRLLHAPPPTAAQVFLSGTLAGLEQAPLPAAWRSMARLTYPVDLPAARAVRMNYPLRWFQIRQVPVVAERVQADTYLACGIVSEALNDMLDSFMRDFLVERIESMVSHRQLTGYYPRLGLAPGQRFASKGSYLVRFTEPSGVDVVPVTEWIVP